MRRVTVRAKDIKKVLEVADEHVRWGSSSWKARNRLLEAIVGLEEEEPIIPVIIRVPADYGTDICLIPACGCNGDLHP